MGCHHRSLLWVILMIEGSWGRNCGFSGRGRRILLVLTFGCVLGLGFGVAMDF